jgi:hypothetical protein
MALATQKGEKSSRPRPTTQVNPRLEKKLGMYLTAAAAAGVGLANTAQAKVVYTPANITVPYPGCVPIDFNADGITDINICLGYGDKSVQFFESAAPGNGVRVGKTLLPVAGIFGVPVGPGEKFSPSFLPMYYKGNGYYGNSYFWGGPWADVTNRYLGVKFSIAGTTHFGWVRMSTSKKSNPVISGYAYETAPNGSIKDGAEVGGDAEVGSVLSPVPDMQAPAAQSASLGLLARGAQGIAIWRRDETADTVPAT